VAELTTSNSLCSSAVFGFLDREPGLRKLGLGQCAEQRLPRSSLVEAFMDSGEFYFKGKFIARTYLGILTRIPTMPAFGLG
jgi:hypothetical protein